MRSTTALVVATLLLAGVAIVPAATVADPAPERTVDESSPAPGDDVRVTVEVDLDDVATVDYVEQFVPAVEDSELVHVELDGEPVVPMVQAADDGTLTVVTEELEAGTLEIAYDVTIPENASAGESYGFDPVLRVGGEQLSTPEGPTELTVGGDVDAIDTGGGDSSDASDDETDGELVDAPNETDVGNENGDTGVDDRPDTSDEETSDENERTDDASEDGNEQREAADDSTDDELVGFGLLPAVAALGAVVASVAVRRRRT